MSDVAATVLVLGLLAAVCWLAVDLLFGRRR